MKPIEVPPESLFGYGSSLLARSDSAPEEEYWAYLRVLGIPYRARRILAHLRLGPAAARERVARAWTFFTQAEEFWKHARAASFNTSPLFYYYCFLNLVKFYIAIVNPRFLRDRRNVRHGLSYPGPFIARNGRLVFREEQVQVRVPGIFPEFQRLASGDMLPDRTQLHIEKLLPSCTMIGAEVSEAYGDKHLPVRIDQARVIEFSPGQYTFVVSFSRHELEDRHYGTVELKRLNYGLQGFRAAGPGTMRLPDRLQGEAPSLAEIERHIEPYLKALNQCWSATPERVFVSVPLSEDGRPLTELSCIYVTMFYLGSIVRYWPQAMTKLESSSGKAFWLLQAFVRSMPLSFLRLLVSLIQARFVFINYA